LLWVLLLTKAPNTPDAKVCLRMALTATSSGDETHLYLVGDGVLYVMKGHPREATIRRLLETGCKVYAKKEDLEARGIREDQLVEGVIVPDDLMDEFMDEIRKEDCKVVCF